MTLGPTGDSGTTAGSTTATSHSGRVRLHVVKSMISAAMAFAMAAVSVGSVPVTRIERIRVSDAAVTVMAASSSEVLTSRSRLSMTRWRGPSVVASSAMVSVMSCPARMTSPAPLTGPTSSRARAS